MKIRKITLFQRSDALECMFFGGFRRISAGFDRFYGFDVFSRIFHGFCVLTCQTSLCVSFQAKIVRVLFEIGVEIESNLDLVRVSYK